MTTIYDVPTNELIEKTAEKLKGFSEIRPPEWASYVKTGRNRERPPTKDDWWYVRSASVLRSVYKLGPIGVSKLRVKYGGKKNRGVKAERTYKSSGNILRKILQQLEKAQLVRQTVKDVHKGRVITPKGRSLLDKTSVEIYKNIVGKSKQDIVKSEKIEKVDAEKDKAVKETPEKKEKKEAKEVKENKK